MRPVKPKEKQITKIPPNYAKDRIAIIHIGNRHSPVIQELRTTRHSRSRTGRRRINPSEHRRLQRHEGGAIGGGIARRHGYNERWQRYDNGTLYAIARLGHLIYRRIGAFHTSFHPYSRIGIAACNHHRARVYNVASCGDDGGAVTCARS